MDSKTLARIGAAGFVALAIAANAFELTRPAVQADAPMAAGQRAQERDPLEIELGRCGQLGEAGGRDASCLRAWSDNRQRFLGHPISEPAADGPAPAVTVSSDNRADPVWQPPEGVR